MTSAQDKFSVMSLDYATPVVMQPPAGRLEVGDLLQWAGKLRVFGEPGMEVDIPPVADQPADSVYVVVLRRRRR